MSWFRKKTEEVAAPKPRREIGIVTNIWFGMDRGELALTMDVKGAEWELALRMNLDEAKEFITRYGWTNIHAIEGEAMVIEINYTSPCRFIEMVEVNE